MTPTTIIQNIAHYGHGDIYAQQNAGAQKVDASWLLWPAVILIGGSAVAGLAVEAFAIGAMLAPFVVGGAATVGATWAGIKGVTVWQRRLLKQAAAVQPALPLPAFDYKALPEPARTFALEYYAHTGKHLTPGQLEALEMQLVAAQLTNKCASLPSPSESLPLRASQPGR